ncbi:sigma-70 family RNA polymerase sigma factor [Mucilaginibacter sp. UR6-1]|uniref:RNA polymerase sigma factor n=1 Tax=Mucilaginibacter sp. UR6-1 TaxID=1435643 RepID=UPI001E2F681B|nr:sigma-70 family RNA polymerase sigma factor [Mucilaginibacter sp. UR6-1]MCC8408177.1 sigma-70 family RNA polymerase sigma factor [Mucilaginibacter sp. UR6-1]
MYTKSLYHADDKELLYLLGQGSKQAFDILYDKYWKKVYNAAYKRLNDTVYAQDIAQDVFVQLWTRASKAPIDNLPAYLAVAARNGVFKHMEKQSRFADLPDAPVHIEGIDKADERLLFSEFHKAFYQLIETLPTQQRIIFKMRFEDDLTSAEIAEALQISPKTVRNQIGKALTTIKSSLLVIQLMVYFYQQR